MTHTEALEAAARALGRDVDAPLVWTPAAERAVAAYLAAYGVRDLGALVEAARFYSSAWTTHTEYHPFGSTYAIEAHTEPSEELWRDAGERARAALTAPAQIGER